MPKPKQPKKIGNKKSIEVPVPAVPKGQEVIEANYWGVSIYPAILCPNTTSLDPKNLVSRIHLRYNQGNTEADHHLKAQKKFGTEFIPYMHSFCHIPIEQYKEIVTTNLMNKIGVGEYMDTAMQLVHDYAGIDLAALSDTQTSAAYAPIFIKPTTTTITFRELFMNMGPIFKGIDTMNKAGYSHMSISARNILYNPETKQMKLIGFGNLDKHKSIYGPSYYKYGFHLTDNQQMFYSPPEFVMFEEMAKVVIKKSGHMFNPDEEEVAVEQFADRAPYVVKTDLLDLYRQLYTAAGFNKKPTITKITKAFKPIIDRIDVYLIGQVLRQLSGMKNKGFSKSEMKHVNAFIDQLLNGNAFKRPTPADALVQYTDICSRAEGP